VRFPADKFGEVAPDDLGDWREFSAGSGSEVNSSDCVPERNEFELVVPILEQPDDSLAVMKPSLRVVVRKFRNGTAGSNPFRSAKESRLSGSSPRSFASH